MVWRVTWTEGDPPRFQAQLIGSEPEADLLMAIVKVTDGGDMHKVRVKDRAAPPMHTRGTPQWPTS